MPTGKPLSTLYVQNPTEDLQVANKQYVDSLPSTVVRTIIINTTNQIHGTGGVQFGAFNGSLTSLTLTNVTVNLALAGTLQNLRVLIITNGASDTNTLQMNISASTGNLSVSYTTGQTGSFQDLSNTDVIAVTDEVASNNTQSTAGDIDGRWSVEYVFS